MDTDYTSQKIVFALDVRESAGFELQPEKKSLAAITAPGDWSNITIIQMQI